MPLLAWVIGCRDSFDAGTVVEFWAMGREGEVVQRLVPEFERRVPGVQVRVQQIPWSAAHEKLLTAYVGDAMPDAFQVGNTWIAEFVALDAIEALETRVAGSSVIEADDYFPGILDTNVIDGHLHGVPWYVDTRLLFYRSEGLDGGEAVVPPHTWQAWRETMARIKAQVGPERYAIFLPLTEWQPPVILAMQLGATLLRDDDQYGNFRSPQFRTAFDFYLGLFRDGLAPRAGAAQVANLYQDFAAGYFSLYITGPWNIGEFRRRLPVALDGKWATAPLPSPTAAYPGVSVAGGASLALFRGARHKDAAWRWIEFLSEPEQQLAFHHLTGDLPARRSAWTQAPGLEHDRYAQAFWLQLQHVRSTPKVPEWERIADKVRQYVEAAVREEMTADAALAALDADVDALLEKRRWMLKQRAPIP